MLEDDNVTYTPTPASSRSVADAEAGAPTATAPLEQPRPWRLDPIPLVLHEREWATLEAGVVQRAELLDAVHAVTHFGPGGRPRGQQFRPPADLMERFAANPRMRQPVRGLDRLGDLDEVVAQEVRRGSDPP